MVKTLNGKSVIRLAPLSFLIALLPLCGCHRAQLGTVDWLQFDGQRALAHTEKLVALGPRPSGSEANKLAQRYIIEQLRVVGLTPREQEWDEKTPHGTVHFKNIIAEVPGAKTAPVVVLGGHYDTKLLGLSARAGMPVPHFVGANDGGSSAGALLEAARVLAKKPPATTVWLVFFDGEEAVELWSDTDGIYGSRHFVRELQASKEIQKIGAAVVVDMIGDKDLTVTIPPESSPSLVKTVFRASDAVGVRSRFSYSSRALTDDHTPFLFAGVAAVDVIDFEYGSQHGANNYWHTTQDTMDKLSAESLRMAGQVTLRAVDELVWRLAGGERFKM